ncbi:glycosyltransferase family 87 protein [Actinomycetospora chibensis]|uniref:Glycosyltransferase family 87 protein n=1 Tax=Actinomycetospora chibensis TaxID=663606 RepID=A0ABV9RHE5_9PSEU|nr:glycosyltransferase family 87 protein [Actinomycetospora chibensis]MDD7922500.1 glycosyltransferase family 87 protein [Actinomycetospora chibensis]
MDPEIVRGFRRWAPALLGAVFGVVLTGIAHQALLDDAFITLSYARNLAEHGCWCVTPDLASNTATSPLWVVLLALPMLVLPPVPALGIVSAGLMAVISTAVSGLARRWGWSAWAGPVAAALLASSPTTQAAFGLESLLAVAVLTVAAHEVAVGRPVGVGIASGALLLVRPDLGVVAILAVALTGRRVLVAVTAAALTVLPWLVVSLLRFGTVLPDTLIWKQSPGQKAGLRGYMFGEAVVLFARTWPAATWLSLAGAAAGVVAALWLLWRAPRRRPVALLAVGALTHVFLLYLLDVAPYPWYPAPAVGAGLVLLALAAGAPGMARWVAVAACAVLVSVGAAYVVRHDYAGTGSPFNYNRATPSQYAAVVARAPDRAVVETYEELGAVAFFCADRCTVVDPLSDRARIAPVIEQRLADSPLLRALYPGWVPPGPPTPATHEVVVREGGVVTFGFNGFSTMDVHAIG